MGRDGSCREGRGNRAFRLERTGSIADPVAKPPISRHNLAARASPDASRLGPQRIRTSWLTPRIPLRAVKIELQSLTCRAWGARCCRPQALRHNGSRGTVVADAECITVAPLGRHAHREPGGAAFGRSFPQARATTEIAGPSWLFTMRNNSAPNSWFQWPYAPNLLISKGGPPALPGWQ